MVDEAELDSVLSAPAKPKAEPAKAAKPKAEPAKPKAEPAKAAKPAAEPEVGAELLSELTSLLGSSDD